MIAKTGSGDMKETFEEANEQLNRIGICRISTELYLEPKKRGSLYFVKSPISNDRHWSLCLYPASNSFCDFAGGNRGGDAINFISYVKGINNWEALKLLKDFYGIADSQEKNREEIRRNIRLQQEQERKRRERERDFHVALLTCIDDLKRWVEICTAAIEGQLFEPFTSLWEYCINQKQIAEYKLDILTGADCTYRRLKACHENLSSDRFRWLLDCLAILEDCGAFAATKSEIAELKAQAIFEMTRRPGQERRCGVEW